MNLQRTHLRVRRIARPTGWLLCGPTLLECFLKCAHKAILVRLALRAGSRMTDSCKRTRSVAASARRVHAGRRWRNPQRMDDSGGESFISKARPRSPLCSILARSSALLSVKTMTRFRPREMETYHRSEERRVGKERRSRWSPY